MIRYTLLEFEFDEEKWEDPYIVQALHDLDGRLLQECTSAGVDCYDLLSADAQERVVGRRETMVGRVWLDADRFRDVQTHWRCDAPYTFLGSLGIRCRAELYGGFGDANPRQFGFCGHGRM